MPSLREHTEQYLAMAHSYTELSRRTLEDTDGITEDGLDPAILADTMRFLLTMVAALEDSVGVLARACDALAANLEVPPAGWPPIAP